VVIESEQQVALGVVDDQRGKPHQLQHQRPQLKWAGYVTYRHGSDTAIGPWE